MRKDLWLWFLVGVVIPLTGIVLVKVLGIP